MEELYTITEVSKMLKVSRTTLYKWKVDGRLRCYKMGKFLRVPKSSIDELLKEVRAQSATTGYHALSNNKARILE